MTAAKRRWAATFAILALGAAIRLVAWQRQPELSYDGAYYVRQADRLARLEYDFEGFPPGYPAAIALVRPVAGDPVRAARIVSLLAGLATLVLVHRGLAPALPPRWADAAAVFLAVHPDLARVHVETMSEPLYGLLLVAGFVLHARRRFAVSAACLGFAFCVRPEAVVPLLGLTAARWFETRRVPWSSLAGWVPVAAFAVVASITVGHPVLSPKQGQLDLGPGIGVRLDALAHSVRRCFPWILLLFALWFAARNRRTWLWAALPPIVLPLAFAVHVQERMLVPVVPFWTILALEWMRTLAPRLRAAVAGVALALFAFECAPGVRALLRPVPLSPHARRIGTLLRPHLQPGDRLAARFPMIAYFAGVDFVRPHALAYDALLDTLRSEGATHVAVVEDEVQRALPQFAPLLHDARFAAGEGRLSPVARVDAGPGGRTVLYRFAPSLLHAQVAIRDVRGACWRGEELVVARGDGDLHVLGQGDAPLARTPEIELEPQCRPGARRVVVCQVGAAGRWLAALDDAGNVTRWPATAGDDPTSPADAGDYILYVRRTQPPGIRALEVATGRVRDVRFRTADAPGTPPRAIAVRGRDVAVTFRGDDAAADAEVVVAVATWNAAGGDVVLDAQRGLGLPLADDAIAWVGDTDRLLVASRHGGQVTARSSVACVQPDGTIRRLTFAPAVVRQPRLDAAARLLFLGANDVLYTAQLAPAAFEVPQAMVFPPR